MENEALRGGVLLLRGTIYFELIAIIWAVSLIEKEPRDGTNPPEHQSDWKIIIPVPTTLNSSGLEDLVFRNGK